MCPSSISITSPVSGSVDSAGILFKAKLLCIPHSYLALLIGKKGKGSPGVVFLGLSQDG